MKDFITYNFKNILIVIGFLLLLFFLVRIFSKTNDNSELVKYKLEKLDEEIGNVKDLQKEFRDSISSYKKDIKKIDENITNIKTQRNVTNNYYDKKIDELKMLDAKKVDSLLRKRYNY
jgi:septal ring factor EnvC (AmiA/AmiB activator)